MAVRTIVFDFGNVLGYFSHRKAAEQLAAFGPPGIQPEEIIPFMVRPELEHPFEMGRLTPTDVLGQLRKRFDLGGTHDQLAHAFADMFTPNEHACSLVPRLQGRYRLVLLSNTNDLHYRHFRRQFASTLDRFDVLVVSHEVGVRKPDRAIYEHAHERAGCAPGECLFIDDLPVNIEAARACGWQGIVYRQGDNLVDHLRQAGVDLEA